MKWQMSNEDRMLITIRHNRTLRKSQQVTRSPAKSPTLWRGDVCAPCRPQSRRYKGLKPGELPTCESLKDTIARALPYWNDVIAPEIKAGKNVIIAAHGNSLRGIVKHLEGELDEVVEMNVFKNTPTQKHTHTHTHIRTHILKY